VIGGETRRGKGVDRGHVAQSGTVAFDDAALFEGGADHAPQPVVGRIAGIGYGRPVHDFVEPGDHQAFGQEGLLFVVTEPAATPLVGGRRHGGARQGKDFHRRSAPARFQPEFQVAGAVDVGKFVARLTRPGHAMRHYQRRLPFGRQMGAFDMFVCLAEARHGRKIRLGKALVHLANITAGRADIGDTAALDDDLLIVEPCPGVDIEQSADAQQPVGGPASERRQHKILARPNLVGRVDQQVIRKCGARGNHE